MHLINDLKKIAEIEYAGIVKNTLILDYKLRIILIDNSFIDINLSQKLPEKFGFHWERMDTAGTIFRYDNFPDKNWENLSSYPFHFHKGSQDAVEISPFPPSILEGFRAFMEFVQGKVNK